MTVLYVSLDPKCQINSSSVETSC